MPVPGRYGRGRRCGTALMPGQYGSAEQSRCRRRAGTEETAGAVHFASFLSAAKRKGEEDGGICTSGGKAPIQSWGGGGEMKGKGGGGGTRGKPLIMIINN
jgi:hypothetical protein